MIEKEVLERLARETARRLAELGVGPADAAWIDAHAGTIASLAGERRPVRRRSLLDRLARRLARAAR